MIGGEVCVQVARPTAVGPDSAWGGDMKMTWVLGTMAAMSVFAAQCNEHRRELSPVVDGRVVVCPSLEAAEYVLPYPVGRSYVCSQGFAGTISHYGVFQFAVDFNMPIGTVVTAARAGQVEFVEEGYTDDSRDINETNLVVVQHSDGTYARYCHLTKNGSLVERGQTVSMGDRIGLSGMSGSGIPLPHLHFDVTTGCSRTTCQTVPFCFRNTTPHPYGPEPGMRYPAEPYS